MMKNSFHKDSSSFNETVLYKRYQWKEAKKFLSLSINVRFARKKASAGSRIMKGCGEYEWLKSIKVETERFWENMDTLQEVWEFRGGRRRESGWMRIFVKEWTNERDRERRKNWRDRNARTCLFASVYVYGCVSRYKFLEAHLSGYVIAWYKCKNEGGKESLRKMFVLREPEAIGVKR